LAAFFEHWDADGSRTISADEIRAGLRGMGLDLSDELVERLLKECDNDNDGAIDYHEFAAAFGKGVGLAAYDLEAHGLIEPFQYDVSRSFLFLVKWGWRLIGLACVLISASIAFWFEHLHVAHVWAALSFMGVLVGLGVALYRNAGVRFGVLLGRQGFEAYHRVVEHVFGHEPRYAHYRAYGWFGTHNFILRDPAMIERAFKHPETYAKAELATFRPFNLKSILGAGSGESWLSYRLLFNKYFASDFREDLPAISALVAERMQHWKARGEIDLMAELFRIIVEVRGHLVFGTRLGCFEDGPDNFADLVDRLLTPPSFPFGGDGAAVNRLHGRVTQALAQCTKPGSVGHICKTQEAAGEMTHEEALQNASVYLLAHAPTAVLFWALYRTAKDGRCHELRTERRRLLQCLKEEMRLHPGVPQLFSRVVKSDDVNEGVHIPKGASVAISPFFSHRNPAAWQAAERFDPDRWQLESDDPKELLRAPTPKPHGAAAQGCPVHRGAAPREAPRFLPFGGGQHMCQGRNLAVEEMVAVMEAVLEHVDLEVVEDHGLLDRPLVEQVRLHVYCRPVHDVKLRVRSR
jgi:cytochrome P450